jgi:glycosyltransferase involved in cell wall biosynthesis
MKVLHVIPSLSRVHGGPTRAIALMELALAEQGVHVEVATTDDDGPGRHNGKANDPPLWENGALHRYFAKSVDFYKVSPSFARWIASNVGRYDLVHIHALFSFVSPVAAWAARRARVPYIVRPLGTLNDYGLKQRRPGFKALSLRFVESPMLRGAAAVHFTSEAEVIEARKLGIPMREALIPLGVEGSGIEKVLGESGATRLLLLSRLDPKKNVEGLLNAVALLMKDMPSLKLTIAGDGSADYVASLKKLADSLGLGDKVVWAGHIEGAEKHAAFASADIFVLPSYSENFGIAAAEALAAGLPCVLGAGVAIAESVTDAGAGVTVGTDAASIASGLREIMANNATLGSMSTQARRLAEERYSVHSMGTSLKQLYTDILMR